MSGEAHGGERECNCEEIFAALSEYLDGELDARFCEQIEAHMEGCGPCRDFLESLRRTVSWLSDQPAPELTPEMREQICAAYRRRCGGS
jgi:RNA polymerase sigma-70 factor (ECF subfamily)